ncbi:MAG TPA: hypothetical protein VF001_06680 [Candidatus Limnocylindria bacterium]
MRRIVAARVVIAIVVLLAFRSGPKRPFVLIPIAMPLAFVDALPRSWRSMR